MPTITKEIASIDNGAVVVQLDYNNANMRADKVRVINNGTAACFVEAKRPDGLIYGQRFDVGTSFITIPQTGGGEIQLIDPGSGKLAGIEISINYPYA